MYRNRAASRHVFDLKVFLLFSWLSPIRFFTETACAWTRITALTITTQHSSLFVHSSARHCSDRDLSSESEAWSTQLSFSDGLEKQIVSNATISFLSKQLQVINYLTINGTSLWTKSGLAQRSISGLHASRGQSSRRSGARLIHSLHSIN